MVGLDPRIRRSARKMKHWRSHAQDSRQRRLVHHTEGKLGWSRARWSEVTPCRPSRTRIRRTPIPCIRCPAALASEYWRDRSFFANFARRLAAVPGVQSVRVNPNTSSILLHHTAPLQKFADHAAEAGLFRLAARPTAPVRRAAPIGPIPPIVPLSFAAAGLAGAPGRHPALSGRRAPWRHSLPPGPCSSPAAACSAQRCRCCPTR